MINRLLDYLLQLYCTYLIQVHAGDFTIAGVLAATVAIPCPKTPASLCPEGVPTVCQPDSHMDTQIITATALTNKPRDKPLHSAFLLMIF